MIELLFVVLQSWVLVFFVASLITIIAIQIFKQRLVQVIVSMALLLAAILFLWCASAEVYGSVGAITLFYLYIFLFGIIVPVSIFKFLKVQNVFLKNLCTIFLAGILATVSAYALALLVLFIPHT